jgi:hypothetical protein
MNETVLTIEAVEFIDGGNDDAANARIRYKNEFPGRTSRRMTHLGMMVSLCLQRLQVQRSIPIVYASAFAETVSLEKFIDSFPEASPAQFQSSIHPSAVEQALIPGRQAIDRFYPIISKTNLAGKGLENCFLLSDESVVLVGGEERATWLCPIGMASYESFAFGLKLSRGGEGIGRITLNCDKPVKDSQGVSCPELSDALRNRQSIEIPSIALGGWLLIEWQ